MLLPDVFALLEAFSGKRKHAEGLFGSAKCCSSLAEIKLRVTAVIAAKPTGSGFNGEKVPVLIELPPENRTVTEAMI